MRERRAFDRAQRRALTRLRSGLELLWTPPRSLDGKAVRAMVTDYKAWEVVTLSADSILEALEIEERYQISFWDALIVQAADASGAEVLYSEDPSHGQIYRAVRVVNPLLAD